MHSITSSILIHNYLHHNYVFFCDLENKVYNLYFHKPCIQIYNLMVTLVSCGIINSNLISNCIGLCVLPQAR